MKTTGVAHLKASLSKYLARVKDGEEVLITERGVPIARLMPLPGNDFDKAKIMRLLRRGAIRLPEKRMDVEKFMRLPWPEDPEGALLKALLADREEGL